MQLFVHIMLAVTGCSGSSIVTGQFRINTYEKVHPVGLFYTVNYDARSVQYQTHSCFSISQFA